MGGEEGWCAPKWLFCTTPLKSWTCMNWHWQWK